MKVKTDTLVGIVLNYAVAICKGHDPICGVNGNHLYNEHDTVDFDYSTNWLLAGQIIESERITINPGRRGVLINGVFTSPDGWTAWKEDIEDFEFEGETPLIAAMRCYVSSKMGEEVEIPDELIDN